MATLVVKKPGTVGTLVTANAVAGGGDVIPNDGQTVLTLDNNGAGAGSCTVTIDSKVNCDQGSDHDVVVSLTAGQVKVVGPFKKSRFDNASGQLTVAYSGTLTGLTILANSAGGV